MVKVPQPVPSLALLGWCHPVTHTVPRLAGTSSAWGCPYLLPPSPADAFPRCSHRQLRSRFTRPTVDATRGGGGAAGGDRRTTIPLRPPPRGQHSDRAHSDAAARGLGSDGPPPDFTGQRGGVHQRARGEPHPLLVTATRPVGGCPVKLELHHVPEGGRVGQEGPSPYRIFLRASRDLLHVRVPSSPRTSRWALARLFRPTPRVQADRRLRTEPAHYRRGSALHECAPIDPAPLLRPRPANRPGQDRGHKPGEVPRCVLRPPPPDRCRILTPRYSRDFRCGGYRRARMSID